MHYLRQQKKPSTCNKKYDRKQKGVIIILGEIYADRDNFDANFLGVLQGRGFTNFWVVSKFLHFQIEEKLSTWRNFNSSVLQKK